MNETITEALAELKTIAKRIEKKRQTIVTYALRDDRIRDPLERDGGSAAVIGQELQAIEDLEARIVIIRLAIQAANQRILITVDGDTRSLAAWLTWRKEVAPARQVFLKAVRDNLARLRKEAQQKGVTFGQQSSAVVALEPSNIVVNVDELALSRESEHIETVLGTLDGQLSLKNATELIDI